MISGRDGSSYQYEIVHKAADIMCTCQYCGCNMCPTVARGGNINMAQQTMWNNNVSCDQEVASSTDIEYIRPIQGTHYFFFLFLLRHLQKSRIGNLSAFPNLTGWLASDIYWKVEWAKTKSEGSWLSRQAGTGTETTADQMESSRCHAREKQVWRSRLRLRIQTSETVDLQNEQYRNC